jgi:fibronectin-binding autotransporter adhesin
MSSFRATRRALSGCLLLASVLAAPATAALYYDVNPASSAIDGGSGNWSDANWKTAAGGTVGTTWSTDNACFEPITGSGTSTTVTADASYAASALTFDGAGYTVAGTGTLTVNSGGIAANQSAVINAPLFLGATQAWNSLSGYALSVGGDVSGTAGSALLKNGLGTLLLSGNNSYAGGTTITYGLLKAGSPTALGSGQVSVLNLNGGQLDLNGQTLANALATGYQAIGPYSTDPGGAAGCILNSNTAATAVINGPITLGGNNYVSGSGRVLLNGLVSGGVAGSYTVLQENAGTWTFANTANTFDGFFYIVAGASTEVTKLANLGQPSSLGQPSTAAGNKVVFGLNISDGGTLRYIGTDASTSDRAFELRGSATNAIEAAGTSPDATLTLTGSAYSYDSTLRTLTLTGANTGNNNCQGPITGATAVTKAGAGTWILSGSNTYSGSTYAYAGVLKVGGSTALSTGRLYVNYSGQADLNAQTVSNPLTLVSGACGPTGSSYPGGAAGCMFNSSTSTAVLNGPVTLGGNNYISGTGRVMVSGLVSGGIAGSYAVFQHSAGTWTYANTANTFDGYYFIAAGATTEVTKLANLNQPSSLGQPSSAAGDAVVFGFGASDGGTLRYVGTDASTSDRSFSLRGSVTNVIDAAGTSPAATLALTGSAASYDATLRTLTLTGTNGGDNNYQGPISGVTAVRKNGTGTWVISGSSSYSGGTYVDAGILKVGGSAALGSALLKISYRGQADLNGQAFSSPLTLSYGVCGPTGSYPGGAAGCLFNSSTTATAVVNGPLTLGGNNYISGTGRVVLNGLVSGGLTSSYAVFQHSAGTWTYANTANTFDGYYYIAAGSTVEATKLGNVGEASSLGRPSSAAMDKIIFGFWDGVNYYDGGTLRYIGTDASTSDRAFVLRGGTANVIDASGTSPAATLTLTGSAAPADAFVRPLTLAGSNAGPNACLGEISGTIAVVKSGAGTWLLGGSNTYTGGSTLNAGRLSISADANLGTGGSLLFNGGVLQITGTAMTDFTAARSAAVNWTTFNGGFDVAAAQNTFTITQTIGGTGRLAKLGSGTLLLPSGASYSGGTTLNAGTLSVSADSALGSPTGPLTFTGAGILQAMASFSLDAARPVVVGTGAIGSFDSQNYTVACPAAIGGSGAVNKLGNGTLLLAASNTFTGTATVSGGTLQIDDGSGTGNILAAVNLAGGTLVFDRPDSYTYAATISGTGNLVQAGSGTLLLTGSNALAGSTNVAGGTLQIGDGGAAGSMACDSIVTGASLVFNRSDTCSYAGQISGGGSLTQAGSGTLVLTNTGNSQAGTVLSGGRLSISSEGNLGASNVLIFNGGLLQVTGTAMTGLSSTRSSVINWTTFNGGFDIADSSNTLTISSTIQGSGSLVKAGSGTLVLAGPANVISSYTGGTVVQAGALQVGDGTSSNGSLGGSDSGDANVLAGATLRFANPAAQSYNGVVSGSGSLVKTAAGTLVLGGSNTFTGGLIVNAGTLQVASANALGSVSGAVTLNGGALDLDGFSLDIGALNSSPGTTVTMGTAALTIGNGDANSTIAGTITGAGGGLTINGTGATLLAGSNSFSGPTLLAANGVLTLADNQALSLSTLDFGTGGGRLGFGSLTAATLGGLSGTNYHGSGFDNRLALANATGTAVTLSVGNNTQSTVFAGDIIGSGSLVKIGSGVLTISGTDSYEGGTTVLGGTLDIASVSALPGNSTLAIANTAEVVFATDLGSAVQLSLMLPGAGGGEPGMTYFRVTASTPASVPEPAAWALLAAAALACAAAWRRRRKQEVGSGQSRVESGTEN